MKTLYIECNMGAAGDMLMAALLELLPDKNVFLDKINNLGLNGIRVSAKPSVKCGITGTYVSVSVGGMEETSVDVDMTEHNHDHEHEHEHKYEHTHEHEHNYEHSHEHPHDHDHEHHHEHHQHRGLNDIEAILSGLKVSQNVREHALAIYRLIAEAESHVHGTQINQIHFHEVGNLDAVADIVGVCLLMEELAPEKVIVSPVHVGSGFVHCAHGILPVPAPATAHILTGVPFYGGKIKGELCTPTGAAILKFFADDFTSMPQMRVVKTGYGMGKKDFEAANCVRVFMGESDLHEGGPNGYAVELRCNVDDMTGEALGFASHTLMEAGAYDVFTAQADMKKDRPGVLLTCVCDEEKADMFASLMLKHTTTFGVRKAVLSRYMLERNIETKQTPFGEVRLKTGKGYGVIKSKLEYNDVAALAKRHGCSISEMERSIWNNLKSREGQE
jgi:pyridinium-3,5-bisthiocarboxylic acid mononucleotide nickel chelatase